MDINNIQALIAQGLITDVASVDPNKAYVAVGVFQPGNRPAGSGNNTYPSYALPLSELLSGVAYTASHGITLVGNDFQLASNLISQFINDSGYVTSATGTTELQPVISQLNNPPGSPVLGDRYLINTAPTGAWVGNANNIAEWNGSGWTYTITVLNNIVYVTTTLTTLRYDGSSWIAWAGTAVLQNGNTTIVPLNIGTNTAQPVTFKTNNLEVGRVLTNGNWGFGTTTPTARVHIKGVGATSATFALKVDSSLTASNGYWFSVSNAGRLTSGCIPDLLNTTNFGHTFAAPSGSLNALNISTTGLNQSLFVVNTNGSFAIGHLASPVSQFSGDGTGLFQFSGDTSQSVGINVTATATIHAKGIDSTSSNYSMKIDNSSGSPLLYVRNDQKVSIGTSVIDASLRIQRNDLTKPALIIGNATGSDNWHYVNSVPNAYAWLDMLDGDMTVSNNYRILHSINNNGVYEAYYNNVGVVRMTFDTAVGNNRIITKTDSNNYSFQVYSDGKIGMASLPTSNTGLSTGDLYVDTAANILANGDKVVGWKV